MPRGQPTRSTTPVASASRASLAVARRAAAPSSVLRLGAPRRYVCSRARSIAGCARSRPSASACRRRRRRGRRRAARAAGRRPGRSRPQRVEHRQRRHALAQVGAGGLAGLVGLGGDVDEVVGELEGDADAARRSSRSVSIDLRRRSRRTSRRSAPAVAISDAGLVGEHAEVVVDRVGRRAGHGRSRGSGPTHSRTKVCAWIRTASAPRSATSSEALPKRRSPVRIADELSQRALAARRAAAQRRPRPSRRRGRARRGGSARPRRRPRRPRSLMPVAEPRRPAASAAAGTACRRPASRCRAASATNGSSWSTAPRSALRRPSARPRAQPLGQRRRRAPGGPAPAPVAVTGHQQELRRRCAARSRTGAGQMPRTSGDDATPTVIAIVGARPRASRRRRRRRPAR